MASGGRAGGEAGVRQDLTVKGRRATHIAVLPRRPRKLEVFEAKDIDRMTPLRLLTESERNAMKAVAAVLPFRVNNHVVDDLIDWSKVPHDPIYQLTFPQPEMLLPEDFSMMYALVAGGARAEEVEAAARMVQARLNPHPGGQLALNVPLLDGRRLRGLQHKYRETLLFFPALGQACHAYCTYCFRWAQFVGHEEATFADHEARDLIAYVRSHRELTNVLFTGGDPMIMKASALRRYVEPLLDPQFDHLQTIRFGTKAPAFWPYRFTTDPDADEMLRLFETIRCSGRHVAVMAHLSHPRELDLPEARRAIRRIQETGAIVRSQAPLVRHVNDSADVWTEMWQEQVRLGIVPYYMFVERDTGPRRYFEVPLARALDLFARASARQSGLGRTVRGPSMSTTPGKVLVDARATLHGEDVFVLRFLQARDPAWVDRPFFARYDPEAAWLDDLVPAFGESEFFYEPALRAMTAPADHA
jgi:KamA family protein